MKKSDSTFCVIPFTSITTSPNDVDTVVKERTRVLELYDRTRNTNYKQLYPFIKEYQWN